MVRLREVHPRVQLKVGERAVYFEGRARWVVEIVRVVTSGAHARILLRYVGERWAGRPRTLGFTSRRSERCFEVGTHLKYHKRSWRLGPMPARRDMEPRLKVSGARPRRSRRRRCRR